MTAMAARPGSGITHDPRWLAAGAGGFLAAVAALWAFRGLPGSGAMLWLASMPILAAGFFAGATAAMSAAGLGAALLWLTAGSWPMLYFAAVIGVPGAMLPLLALRPQGMALGGPLVFMGLYPLLLFGWGAMEFADRPGGLIGTVSATARQVMAEFALPEAMVSRVAGLVPALLALWLAVVWTANAVIAQRALAKRDLAFSPTPGWGAAQLPFWYALLPAAAAGIWLVDRGDPLLFPALLILLLPFFFQGIAGVHRRAAAFRGRAMVLAGFYVLMVVFLQLMAPAVVALGLYDQWARRAPRGGNPT
jgi:hypothetical protein